MSGKKVSCIFPLTHQCLNADNSIESQMLHGSVSFNRFIEHEKNTIFQFLMSTPTSRNEEIVNWNQANDSSAKISN